MRTAEIIRKTAETDIKLTLNLDGKGASVIDTGCGFLDHMLTLFASHGRFDLFVRCAGDMEVDAHHTAEDIGICLGQAFLQCLGDKKGIERYGYMILPMDEALILSAVDLSGRAYLGYDLDIPSYKVSVNDVISVCEKSRATEKFKTFAENTKALPKWLEGNAENFEGKVVAEPSREDIDVPVNETLIVELYSK